MRTTIIFILAAISTCAAEIVTAGIALGSLVGTTSLLGLYQYAKCNYFECCDDRWIMKDWGGLQSDFRTRLYGQHLVANTVVRSLKKHYANSMPSRALVLSFHGWTGSGKTYVADMIANNTYRLGLNSKYVHKFMSTIHFPNAEHVTRYSDQLRHWIRGNVSSCERQLFIFDEVDKMQPAVLEAIQPFIDYHQKIDGIDYRKTTFIFLSNSAGDDITQMTINAYRVGTRREDLGLAQMEEKIKEAAFNEPGGLQYSSLIRNHFIAHLVPFLPLTRMHVRECTKDYIQLRHPNIVITEELKSDISDLLHYEPDDLQLYSKSGCKNVDKKTELKLQEMEDAGTLHYFRPASTDRHEEM